jgi:hypothetical protein
MATVTKTMTAKITRGALVAFEKNTSASLQVQALHRLQTASFASLATLGRMAFVARLRGTRSRATRSVEVVVTVNWREMTYWEHEAVG